MNTTKKTVQLFFISTLFCATCAFSQSIVKFGVKGGLNLANGKVGASGSGQGVSISASIDTKLRASFYLGGLAEFSLRNSKQKVQAEILYAQNGFKYSLPEEDGTVKFSQLLVPIVGKYLVYDNLYLYGGSYFGFKLGVKEKDSDGEEYDTGEDYNFFDVGLIAGAEYNLPNGFFIDARYNFGLMNMLSDVEYQGTVSAQGKYKNRFIQVGLGYKF